MPNQDFVTFYSPGTFTPEMTQKKIIGWNIEEALRMSRYILERHNARPFAFRFSTEDRDGNLIKESRFYYLGGVIRTRESILAGTDPDEAILRSNVRDNESILQVVVNTNSYKYTASMFEGDVVLDIVFDPVDADQIMD
jgi:hypothetical protein